MPPAPRTPCSPLPCATRSPAGSAGAPAIRDTRAIVLDPRPESGSGCWRRRRRRPRGERLEVTAPAAAAFAPARGPTSLRLLDSQWHRSYGFFGRASSRASGPAKLQPRPASAASQFSALSLQKGSPSRSAAEGVRAQPSPSALELSLCICRIRPLTSPLPPPPWLPEPRRRGFSPNLSAREDSQRTLLRRVPASPGCQ
ncbi:unnamed protein product [Rangifer tarandus platyrhynchus]|uniref:Uncharacterized protein n=1 Tax=Rangifer tarandus platyrhynchus TaxID=3082113 RepID=A0AC59Z4Y0_RANTA